MKIKRTIRELMRLFEYKKPVVYVEKVKKGEKTPEGAILDLLFFWDKKSEQPVLAQFFVSESGVAVTVSPKYDQSCDVYSGSGTPKDIAVSVINFLGGHFSKSHQNKRI